MGYLTTITIYNDALDTFEKNPEEFGKAILEGISRAQRQYKEVIISNYINVQPSRHADDETVYIHSGNGVFNLNSYNKDFQELAKSSKKALESLIKRAESILESAKENLKNY